QSCGLRTHEGPSPELQEELTPDPFSSLRTDSILYTIRFFVLALHKHRLAQVAVYRLQQRHLPGSVIVFGKDIVANVKKDSTRSLVLATPSRDSHCSRTAVVTSYHWHAYDLANLAWCR
ncbi:MAG TPA: hypothetical protein VE955_00675, partial [Candidatus Dormibacteraeota bacterium]|nr:hypothetical protein [Candidatus Dormibacteraeota bacterium]